jgi:Rhodopirellula transposase DDE domain
LEQDQASAVLFHDQKLAEAPLTTCDIIVNLIAGTTTKTGLIVRAALDPRQYETGITFSDEDFEHLHLTRAKFYGEWNCTIKPRRYFSPCLKAT